MTKTVVQLHTIDQWVKVDKSIQSVILQNIRLKDRLLKFLRDRQNYKGPSTGVNGWRPCSACDKAGWVLERPRLPGIHPSELPHPCLLKVYNTMVGVPATQKHEARTMLIFDVGHAIHGMFQAYGKAGAWGPNYIPEATLSAEFQELSEELMLEGHADADTILTIDDIPGSDFIYEVGIVHEYKTINNNGFEKLTRPKPEHKAQALIYSAALNRPIVAYLYFNKNDSNLADFPVPFDEEAWAAIQGKAMILKKHFDSKTPPPATTGYHCQQCPYVYTCKDYQQTMSKKGG